MSYKSTALNLPGLVGFWGLDDTGSSSSASDSSANGISLTATGSLSFGQTGFVDGLSTSLQSGAGSMLSAAIASYPEFAMTNSFTLFGWIAFDNAPTVSGYQTMFGRFQPGSGLGSWSLAMAYVNSNNVLAAGMNSANIPANYSTAPSSSSSGSIVEVGDIAFVAATWSIETGLWKLIVNGVIEAQATRDFILPTTTEPFVIGNTPSSQPTLRYSGIGLSNQEIPVGVLRDLMAQNTSFTAPSFGSQHETANPSAIRGSGIDGGHLEISQDSMTTASSKLWRPDQYGSEAMNQPAVILTTSNAIEQLPFQSAKLIREFVNSVMQRPTTNGGEGQTYMDSSGNLQSQLFTSGNIQSNWTVFEMISGISILQTWSRAPADSSLVRYTLALFTEIFSTARSDGYLFPNETPGVSDFIMYELSFSLLLMKKYIDPTTLEQWTTVLSNHFNLFWYGGTGTYLNNPGPESNYYINGNRDLNAACGFYAMYLLTGQSNWLSLYNAQFTKVINSSQNIYNGTPSSSSPATSYPFGLRYYGGSSPAGPGVAPSGSYSTDLPVTNPGSLNISTDQVYLCESNGTDQGLDWDYLGNQSSIMWRLYCLTGQDVHWRIFNCMLNTMWVRVTTSNWYYNYEGGTRHFGNSQMEWLLFEILQVSGKRSDFSTSFTSDFSTHWPIPMNFFKNGEHGFGLNQHRNLGGQLGGILMASPHWPGIQ